MNLFIRIFRVTCAQITNEAGERSNTAGCVNIFLSDFLAPFVRLHLNMNVSQRSHSHLHSLPPPTLRYLTASPYISPHLSLHVFCPITAPSLPLSPSHPPVGLELCVSVCLCAEIAEP